jgi:hypothetical protein
MSTLNRQIKIKASPQVLALIDNNDERTAIFHDLVDAILDDYRQQYKPEELSEFGCRYEMDGESGHMTFDVFLYPGRSGVAILFPHETAMLGLSVA